MGGGVKPHGREGDLRVKTMGLKARFVLATTLPLAFVTAMTALMLYSKSAAIVRTSQQDMFSRAVKFTHALRNAPEGAPKDFEQGELHEETGVLVYPYRYGDAGHGRLYRHEIGVGTDSPDRFDLYVPDAELAEVEMLWLIVGTFVAVLVIGATVSILVADSVSKPVEGLIYDVRQIAMGNLRHRTKASGPAELRLLARAIDHMTNDLAEGKEKEILLSVRQRELELATSVRNALLPEGTPLIEGYDLGASFLASPRFGGDFHEFVQRTDGQWGLLVGEVSGRGVPAALVGATARAYLRSELERPGEVLDAFRRINGWLTGDVRRGMFVSALYALLDRSTGRATVACAGHKIPLLRVCASDGQLRVVQPEGIAFGFDKGSVFDRRLQVVEVPIDPGDRLVLTNSAPVRIKNESGEELGEKPFYARVKKHNAADTTQFLRALKRDLEQIAGEAGFQEDISIVTLSRNPA
jgi:serine phosphatase RsbU (regulator of sigma subunit)